MYSFKTNFTEELDGMQRNALSHGYTWKLTFLRSSVIRYTLDYAAVTFILFFSFFIVFGNSLPFIMDPTPYEVTTVLA